MTLSNQRLQRPGAWGSGVVWRVSWLEVVQVLCGWWVNWLARR
jgi:hypothetical protein